MDPVICALGVDALDTAGRLIGITEHSGSDASFVVCSLMRQYIQEGCGICLVLLHNSFGHHHNVGTKLGYNLRQLQDQGRLVVVEVFKIVASCLSGTPATLDVFSGDREEVVRQLFVAVNTAVEQVLRVSSRVSIIVDDLSDLLCLGVPQRHVLSFLQYCRSLVMDLPTCCLVVCVHVAAEDEAQCLLSACLMHVADVTVIVAGLKTGHCAQVSGTLRVRHKRCADALQWNKQSFYHFRLHDKYVSLFAPGEIR